MEVKKSMTKKIIAVALAVLMLAVILPANAAIQATTVEIRGEVYDASPIHRPNATGCTNGTSQVNATCDASWNANNFAGFWYDLKDGLMSENLTIANNTLTGTSIAADKLLYNATIRAVKFKVGSEVNKTVENGLGGDNNLTKDGSSGSDGVNTVTGGKYYAKIGWQAEEYVALNAKANKLAKIVYEQKSTDKKTLTIGDVWDIGDGYSLTAQSIDTSTSPRQAWLALSKDGVKLDDKIIVQGQVYTYTRASLASETDVPVFVTYVDSVFAGATSDILQLKYTWVISGSVTEIKTGDKFGIMEVMDDGASDNTINLQNDESAVSLSRNSVVDIMGNMKFSIADSATLRFYPMVEYEIVGEGGVVTPGPGTPTATVVGTPVKTPVTNVTVTTPPVTTTAAAAETTAAAVPTTPKTEPGFEAIFAIAGLLAVAFLVLRQRK